MNPQKKLYVAVSHRGTKIGISKDPKGRMGGLDYQPSSLVHVETVPPDLNPRDIERLAHYLVDAFRANKHWRSEWFTITPEEAIEAIQMALVLAREDETTFSWPVRIEINHRTKSSIETLASQDEVLPAVLIGKLLTEAMAARRSAT